MEISSIYYCTLGKLNFIIGWDTKINSFEEKDNEEIRI